MSPNRRKKLAARPNLESLDRRDVPATGGLHKAALHAQAVHPARAQARQHAIKLRAAQRAAAAANFTPTEVNVTPKAARAGARAGVAQIPGSDANSPSNGVGAAAASRVGIQGQVLARSFNTGAANQVSNIANRALGIAIRTTPPRTSGGGGANRVLAAAGAISTGTGTAAGVNTALGSTTTDPASLGASPSFAPSELGGFSTFAGSPSLSSFGVAGSNGQLGAFSTFAGSPSLTSFGVGGLGASQLGAFSTFAGSPSLTSFGGAGTAAGQLGAFSTFAGSPSLGTIASNITGTTSVF